MGSRADFEEVRLPVLRPIILVVLVLLGVFTGCIYWLQQRRLDAQVRERVGRVKFLLRENLAQDARLLRGLSEPLLRDRALQQDWRAGDRAALLQRTQPVLEEWRARYDITHLYFHDAERVCVLRVHDPHSHGDRITRATLDRAAAGDGPAWGLELEPTGTFTLRLVQPWCVDGRRIGYLELGQELGGVVATLKHVLDVELVMAVDKSFLDRPSWEQGMRMLGRTTQWDLLPYFVIGDHTLGAAAGRPVRCPVLCARGREDQLFNETIAGRHYRGGTIVVSDVADRPVGRIAVLCDVGPERAALRLLLVMLLDLSVVVVASLGVLFGRFIRDIERRLTAVYTDLKAEIRKRRAVEEELREHQDNLEALVRRRTVELETTNRHLSQEIADRLAAEKALSELNQELEHTISQLNVANRDLKDLLRVAAHDLKAPIRAVGTLVDWIDDDCKDVTDASSRAHLNLLRNRIQRLNRHVDRILEYSEVSSVVRPARPTDLNAVVREVIKGMTSSPGIRIVVENELPVLATDWGRMVQVFENLVGNAVKYLGRPQGVVRIGCIRQGYHWTFHVSDDGPGIEERFFTKIFEMFQTLSPRDEVEATGIGLSIVKRIVELHGGTIWVESTVGQGSTFFFTLPAQPAEAVATAPEAGTAPQS